MSERRRVVALADTDSYVKWGAALLGALDDGWDASLLVVETPHAVSAAQLDAALAGSGVPPERVARVAYTELVERLGEVQPDAVLLAARGPFVRVLARDVLTLTPRPVIVTGLPGISIPVTRKALRFRAQCDLFVVHSRRERREFAELAVEIGLEQSFALATLPFARRVRDASSGGIGADAGDPGAGTDLVFAAQAKVPAERADRLRVARMLVRAARADPGRRVVLKLRAAAGEHQTHAERDAYPDLLATLGPLPPNLVTSTASMAHALDTAQGLVTISSTAAIEAVARGVPVIALDTFGVAPELINEVLADAGLLGSETDVIERRFRMPAEDWFDENYFHEPAADDWDARVREAIEANRDGMLVPRPPLPRRGGALRDAWDRKSVLGPLDRTFVGRVAALIGVPTRAVLRVLRAVRPRRVEHL